HIMALQQVYPALLKAFMLPYQFTLLPPDFDALPDAKRPASQAQEQMPEHENEDQRRYRKRQAGFQPVRGNQHDDIACMIARSHSQRDGDHQQDECPYPRAHPYSPVVALAFKSSSASASALASKARTAARLSSTPGSSGAGSTSRRPSSVSSIFRVARSSRSAYWRTACIATSRSERHTLDSRAIRAMRASSRRKVRFARSHALCSGAISKARSEGRRGGHGG